MRKNTLGGGLVQTSFLETFVSGHGPLCYRYLGAMWFDFFPWSVLLPAGGWLLASRRLLTKHPAELFVLLWLLAFFVSLGLVP